MNRVVTLLFLLCKSLLAALIAAYCTAWVALNSPLLTEAIVGGRPLAAPDGAVAEYVLGSLIVAIPTTLLILAVLLCVALPVRFVMQRFGLNGALTVSLGFAAIGASVLIILMSSTAGYVMAGVTGLMVGLSSGIIFWLIRRPDKDLTLTKASV